MLSAAPGYGCQATQIFSIIEQITYALMSSSEVSVAPSVNYLLLRIFPIVKVFVFQIYFVVQASLVTRQKSRRQCQLTSSSEGKKDLSKSEACVLIYLFVCLFLTPQLETRQDTMVDGKMFAKAGSFLLTVAVCSSQFLVISRCKNVIVKCQSKFSVRHKRNNEAN